MTATPIIHKLDVVEDVDNNEVLVDVTDVPDHDDVLRLDAEIQAMYQVESVETYFHPHESKAHEFRIYHLKPGTLAR